MFTIDKIHLLHAACKLPAPPPLDDRHKPECQNHADHAIFSPGMPHVVQLEQHFGLAPALSDQLGVRVRAIEAKINPLMRAKKQVVAFPGFYSVALCQLNPDRHFVFGDNLQRVGMGGQAIIRQQPNIIGVATKRDPGNGFMTDCPFDMGQAMADLLKVDRLIAEGKRVVIPVTKEGRVSLGCGLAELPYRAPLIYATIEAWFRSLKNIEYVK